MRSKYSEDLNASLRPTFSVSRKSAAQVEPFQIQFTDHFGKLHDPIVAIVAIFDDTAW